MSGPSKNSFDYFRVQSIISAMESLLTCEQSKRILLSTEWGGFDAGMKSLARVSDQIKADQNAKAEKAAYNEGRIISLVSQVESEKGRADRAMAAIDNFFQRLADVRRGKLSNFDEDAVLVDLQDMES